LSNLNAGCLSQFWEKSHSLQKKKGGLSHPFGKNFFSHKLNGQPTLKFDKDMEVHCIYCMIPRTPGFLGWVYFFVTCHSKRSLLFDFLKLIVAFMDPFVNQIHVSWYHAIDTKHVHTLVKFERRLSISVLSNKSFFTKKTGFALSIWKKFCFSNFSQTEWTTCVQIWQGHGRTSHLLYDTWNAWFPWMSSLFRYVPLQPVAFLKFILVLMDAFNIQMMFLGIMQFVHTNLGATGISRCFVTSYRHNRWISHMKHFYLTSSNKHLLHHTLCEI
jgi:hypothetical protein